MQQNKTLLYYYPFPPSPSSTSIKTNKSNAEDLKQAYQVLSKQLNELQERYYSLLTSKSVSKFEDRTKYAAVKIQSCWRGYTTRKVVSMYLQQHAAAVKVQAVWRGYHTRKKLRNQSSAMPDVDNPLITELALQLHKEAQRTSLMEEAVRYLWREVQQLRKDQASKVHKEVDYT